MQKMKEQQTIKYERTVCPHLGPFGNQEMESEKNQQKRKKKEPYRGLVDA